MELAGSKLDTDAAARDLGAGQGRGRPARARDLRHVRRGVHARLAQAARGGPVRQARPVAQAARQDRLLDRRPRAPGDPARASGDPQDRALARADQAGPDLPRRAPAADRLRRADPHHVQPDRGHHRPAVLEQPEPAEHPDPDAAGARDPRLLRRRAGQSAGLGRLFAGRTAAAGPHRRRGRPKGNLPKGRRCPHRHGLPRVWGDTGADRPGNEIQVEDDQLRHRLRPVGMGDGRPARHPPGGGRGVHPALHGGLPRGGALDRGDDRAGHRARLRLDSVRPPPAGPRAPGPALGAAQAGRAVRGQHGDPGHRRRHHEGGDGALRPGA